MKKKDLTNQKFGNLLVISRDESKTSPCGTKHSYYTCQCDCGNIVHVRGSHLTSGRIVSCGCNKNKKLTQRNIDNRKHNTYNMTDYDYGIIYDYNGEVLSIFDKDDYDLIKQYYWSKQTLGYVRGYPLDDNLITQKERRSKSVLLHDFVMGLDTKNNPNNLVIDHINHNTYDNRKQNLRFATKAQNIMNRNSKGVSKRPNGKYTAQITFNGKIHYLGYFNTYEEAKNARLEAENQYFKEFSYNNSLKLCEERESNII